MSTLTQTRSKIAAVALRCLVLVIVFCVPLILLS